MKGERRLRLVPPPAAHGEEPPPTEAELRAAHALREAMEQGADPLAASLKAAFQGGALDEEDHDAILERAIGSISPADAPPTKAEIAGGARLRAELEGGGAPGAGAGSRSEEGEIAGALRAAWAPRPIDPQKNEALIAEAVRKAAPASGRRGRVLSITMVSIATAAAMAAGILLMIGRGIDGGGAALESASVAPAAPGTAAHVSLIRARSAAELFDAATPFPRTGGESARIDRIASARAADLRANRFASWGVQ